MDTTMKLQALLAKIKASTFVKSAITLMSGTVVAQVLSLASYPILTQMYEPDAFGLLGIYAAILSIIIVLANGGYETAIMLPEDQKSAHHIYAMCISLTVFTSALAAVIIYFFLDMFKVLISDYQLYDCLRFLPLSILLEGAYVSSATLLNRYKLYRLLTISKIMQALVNGLVSLLVGYYFKTVVGGLVVGFVCGQAAAFLVVLFQVISLIDRHDFNYTAMKTQARSFKDFPQYAIGASYLNTVSRQLPFFIIPYFYVDKNVLGYFTLAHKILTAPLTFVGTTVSQIFYEKAARAKEKGMNNLKSITLKLTGVIGVLSIIPCLVIVIWGKEIFELVFGSHYAIAGHYARWIMPWITLTYLVSPLSFLVNVKRKLKFDLLYNIILFITRIIVLVIGGYYFSAETSIAIFCMVGLCFNLFLLLWLIQISGQSENEYAG